MVAAVVGAGRATIQELRSVYTLEDLFDMYSIIVTDRYNEWLANERAKSQKR